MNDASNQPGVPAKSARLQQALVLIFFVAIAILPVFYYGAQSETPKWMAASAMENFDNGRLDLAVPQLTEAYHRSDSDFQIAMQLVQVLIEAGKPAEALKLCNEVLADEGLGQVQRQIATMNKSHCLQHLGKFKEALTVYKSQEFQASGNNAVKIGRLNNLAYFRGLAEEELVKAERDISRAIDLVEETHYSINSQIFLKIATRTLMGIAIVSRYTGRQSEILPMLGREIENLENGEFQTQVELTGAVDAFFSIADSSDQKKLERATKSARIGFQKNRQSLAMLLTVRALLYQDLGRQENSDQDRFQVTQLGFDPDILVGQLPDGAEAVNLLSQAMTYLDTRGFVRLKRSRLDAARPDIDLAILAAETSLQAMTSPIANSPYYYNGSIDLRGLKRELQRTSAVLHFHRIELDSAELRSLEKKFKELREADRNADDPDRIAQLQNQLQQKNALISQRMDADRKRVVELGYDPDKPLF